MSQLWPRFAMSFSDLLNNRHKKARFYPGFMIFCGLTSTLLWCRWPDLNRHGLRHYPLKIACLPIPPHRHIFYSVTTSVSSTSVTAVLVSSTTTSTSVSIVSTEDSTPFSTVLTTVDNFSTTSAGTSL